MRTGRLLANLRLARRLAALLALVLACVPLHYAWRAVRRPSPWPRRFLGWAGYAFGVRVTCIGRPLDDRVFFISNHVSWLDILVLGGATGGAFIAKAELEHTPVIGWLASLNRTVFVDRGDRRGMGDQIDRIRQATADRKLTLFPEGTTGDGAALLPFKASLLQMLDPPPPGIRVQPLALDYGEAAQEIAWTEEGGAKLLHILRRRGAIPVVLHCLAPFDPAATGDRKAIAAEARERIAGALPSFRSP